MRPHDAIGEVVHVHSLTILFESIEEDQMQVCKVTFGAEPMEQREQSDACIDSAESRERKTEGQPTDQEVLEFFDRNWNKLKYSKPVVTEVKSKPKNPKRLQRDARKQIQSTGIGTKSQQALKQQQEENKLERKSVYKKMREAEKERKYELKQAKRKEKHKGH